MKKETLNVTEMKKSNTCTQLTCTIVGYIFSIWPGKVAIVRHMVYTVYCSTIGNLVVRTSLS